MKYLSKPLLKTATITFFTVILIVFAPPYINFMTDVDLLSWAGIHIPEDNQALAKVFLTMLGGMIMLYWPIDSIFKSERKLIPLIVLYLASIFIVAVLVESGESPLSKSILWQLSIFGNTIAAVFFFTKYYFLVQDSEEH